MKQLEFLIGTYTANTASKGIYASSLNLLTGKLTRPRPVANVTNPSYVIRTRKAECLYSVVETEQYGDLPTGGVVSLRQKDGKWVETGALSSGGTGPCHLAVDERKKLLAVANYNDGMMSMYKLDDEGALLEQIGTFPGPEGMESHAHMCLFFDKALWCTDLGADRIRRYQGHGKKWHEIAPILLPKGCGPRHIAVHPMGDTVYVGCELNSHLYTLQARDGEWTVVQDNACVPADARSYVAAVRLEKERLYVSNRGYDSASVFVIDPETHLPVEESRISCPASFPRDILVAGDCILFACQKADVVVAMRKQPDGSYQETDRLTLPMPVCLLKL